MKVLKKSVRGNFWTRTSLNKLIGGFQMVYWTQAVSLFADLEKSAVCLGGNERVNAFTTKIRTFGSRALVLCIFAYFYTVVFVL